MKSSLRKMMNMNFYLLLICFAFSSLYSKGSSPIGLWLTIDDKTGETKSFVKIYQGKSGLEGKLDSVFSDTIVGKPALCDKCSGEKKGKPLKGLVILWGMKNAEEFYEEGEILDPANGKTYSCKLKVTEGGKSLEVRGFLGISLLGRTQVWKRLE